MFAITQRQDCFGIRDKKFVGRVRITLPVGSETKQEEENDNLEIRLIYSVNSRNYELIHALPVEIECSKNECFAKFSLVDIFATGRTPDEAIEDFRFLFVDYFDSLLKKEGTLGINLKNELEIMGKYLRKID